MESDRLDLGLGRHLLSVADPSATSPDLRRLVRMASPAKLCLGSGPEVQVTSRFGGFDPRNAASEATSGLQPGRHRSATVEIRTPTG